MLAVTLHLSNHLIPLLDEVDRVGERNFYLLKTSLIAYQIFIFFISVGLDPEKPETLSGILDVSPKSATSNPVLVS